MLGGVPISPTHRVRPVTNQDNHARILLDALGDNSITIVDKMDTFLGRTSRVDHDSWSCETTRPNKVKFNFSARLCRSREPRAPVPDAVKEEYAYLNAEKTVDAVCALIRKRMIESNMSSTALAAKLDLSQKEASSM